MRRFTSLDRSARPVLVDITKDVFQAQHILARFDDSPAGLQSLYRRPRRADPPRRANDLGSEASFRLRRWGIIAADASEELRALVELIDAPASAL